MPLSEDRRKQLDGIVAKMADNQESDEDIQFVVDDFKKKYEGEAQAEKPSVGSKVLAALVPSVNKPFPTIPEIDPKRFEKNPVTGAYEFAKTGNQVDLPVAGKIAVGVGRTAADLVSAPKRALGAAGATMGAESMASGSDFLERMADPESGLLKGARKALAEGDAPAAVKILGEVGLGTVEDPLTVLGGIMTAAKITKFNASALPEATKAVKVSEDVAEAAALKGGQKGVSTGEVSGVPFSKAQQIGLSGGEITPDVEKIARMEADIKKRNESVWNEFVADQQNAIGAKVEGVKAKHGFSDQAPTELTDNVISRIDEAFETQKVKLKKSYDEIEKAAAEAPAFDNDALADAKKTMDDLGVYPVRKDFDAAGNAFTEPDFKQYSIKTKKVPLAAEEQSKATKLYKQSEDVNGVPVSPGADPTHRKEVHFLVSDYIAKEGMDASGVSGKVQDAMIKARKRIYSDGSYQAMKDARSEIGHHIGQIKKGADGYGYADMGKLRLVYKKLSQAMERHIEVSGGGPNGNGAQAVKDWLAADKMFSNRDDFAFLRKVLYGTSEGGTPSADVLRRLTNSGSGRSYDALLKIKDMEASGVVPSGVTHNLQNALFNDLINRSSRVVNGRQVVDGELLLKNAQGIRKEFYNEIFTDDQANDIAQLVLEGMAQKMSNKLKILDSNPNAAAKFIKDAAGNIGFWALLKGGPKGWGKWQLGKLLQKALLTRGDRAATRYIRSVDNKSITTGLFRPVLGSAGLQAAERVVQTPGQIPSPEAGRPTSTPDQGASPEGEPALP